MPAYCLLLFSATNVYYHSFQFSVNQNFKIILQKNFEIFSKKQSSEIPQKTITGNPEKNNHRKFRKKRSPEIQ